MCMATLDVHCTKKNFMREFLLLSNAIALLGGKKISCFTNLFDIVMS